MKRSIILSFVITHCLILSANPDFRAPCGVGDLGKILQGIQSILEELEETDSVVENISSVVDGICDCVNDSTESLVDHAVTTVLDQLSVDVIAIESQLTNISSVVDGLCDCVNDSTESLVDHAVTTILDQLSTDVIKIESQLDNITSIVEHIHCSSGGNSEIESQLDTILSVVDGICDCVSTSSGCGSAIINQLDNIASVVEGLCDCVCDCVSSAASDIEQLITDVFDDLTIDIMVNEMETQDLLSSKIDAVCPCVINSLPPSCPVTLVYNTTPQPLTKPGRYCLAEDIVSIGMAAISIAGSSITLDLNGHRIIGGLGGFAGGIVVENGSNDIRIKNGLITDVTPGINILAASDVRIEDITCSHCTDGIATFTGADGIVISNVICDGTGTGVGLNCGGVNIVVADSIFTHNGPAGASFASANNFVVERCEMSANSGTGLIISNSNNFNVLSCSMNGNQTGLLLNNVTGVIKNSSAASNMGPVAMLTPWIGSGFGVYLNNINGDSSSLVFEECTAHDNVGHGFNISTTSKYIGIVKNCIAFSNNGNGFNNGQLSAQFYGNNAYGNSSYGFNTNPGSGQYYANYACDNTLGNYNDVTTAPVTSAANARGVDNVDCSNSTLDEIDVLNSKIDYLINYLTM